MGIGRVDTSVIESYHRPTTLEEALTLLSSRGAAILGGGTSLVAAGSAIDVVDLQSLGLEEIDLDGDRLVIGAMVRLSDVAEADLTPPLLRDLARREAPSTIRNVATVGGTVATGDPDSELIAGLLVHDAVVNVTSEEGSRTTPLADYLASAAVGIITSISIATGGVGASARTGRTPADRPIVMAAARRSDDGTVAVAVTGVADVPILVDSAAPLEPEGDFRGSDAYRRHLAGTLAERAVTGLDR